MAIQINQKKYNRQLLGIDRWRKAKEYGLGKYNGWGIFWWTTGVGKTFAACDIANRILSIDPASTIVVVVPSEELERQWKQEIKVFAGDTNCENFQVFTIHKVIENGICLACTFLIADEIHEYLTDERLKLFDGTYFRPKYCLGLTATLEDSKGRQKKLEGRLPVVDRIDEQEALAEGFISKFTEYNLGVTLDHTEQTGYAALTKEIVDNLSKFGKGGLELASRCLTGDKQGHTGIQICSIYASSKGWRKDMDLSNPTNQQIFSLWSPSKIMAYASNAMEAIKKRKDILYNAKKKIDVAREIVFKFDAFKAICFSQSTKFADRLAYSINLHSKVMNPDSSPICVVYHSKIQTIVYTDAKGKQKKKGKTVLKREAIAAIRDGIARIISTASSLDRGFDVKDIRLGITTSGTQNPTQHKQRNGRVVRIESYDEEIPVLIVNIYVRNTKDQEWLERRQSKSKNVVYWVDSVEDITYNAKPLKYNIPA